MKREHFDLLDEIVTMLRLARNSADAPYADWSDTDVALEVLPDLLAAVPTEYRRIPWLAFLLNAPVIDADTVELWWKAEGNALERRLAQAYGVEV